MIMHLDVVANCLRSLSTSILSLCPSLIIHSSWAKGAPPNVMNQQVQGTCYKCRFLGTTPDLLNLCLHFNKIPR